MMALILGLALPSAWAEEPAGEAPKAPARVERAQLLEPIAHLMSDRTKKAVSLPGTALLEWDRMGEVEVGTYVDVWTRSPKGVCMAASRAQVVLSPNATGDTNHSAHVIRVPAADKDRLQALKYASWTPRRADDPRPYKELWCE